MTGRSGPSGVVVQIEADAAGAAEVVAGLLDEAVRRPGHRVLGVAAGTSPVEAYTRLVARRPPVDELHVVLLDEYAGLGEDHPASFRRQIRTVLTDPLGLPPERLHSLDGLDPDPDAACRRFERTLAGLGGVDLQLLGIGRNGHIAFNEPGSALDSRTRPITLTASTRAANATAFPSVDDVPARALTQGIGTILEARRLVLLATGPAKADAVALAIDGPVGDAVPASALQRHPDVIVVLDRSAASGLRR